MRKGFDALSALVAAGLQRDPLNGDVYTFVSRDRVRAKVLHWGGTGLCIYARAVAKSRSDGGMDLDAASSHDPSAAGSTGSSLCGRER
jgi:hypothetical protein